MYLPRKVYGLPKAKREGFVTSPTGKTKTHLYRVKIGDNTYFKVHLKRQNKSKIKYFKTRLEAQLFVDSLRLQPYL